MAESSRVQGAWIIHDTTVRATAATAAVTLRRANLTTRRFVLVVHEEIVVRPAVASDAAGISALIHASLRHLSPHSIEPAPKEFVALFATSAIEEYIEAANYNYFVAVHLGHLIGVIGVRDNSQLVHLFVSESHQRRGIASALWSRAKAVALAAEPEVEIVVRSSIYAAPVYERFGFRACGPRVDDRGVSYVPMSQVIRRND